MGRFESPLQVVGLFLAASVISVGVIFFLNAEAHSRLSSSHHNNQLEEKQEPPVSLPLHSSSPHFSYLTQGSDGGGQGKQSLQSNTINSIVKDSNSEVNGADFGADSFPAAAANPGDSARSLEINDVLLPGSMVASLYAPSPSLSSELTTSILPKSSKASEIITSHSVGTSSSSLSLASVRPTLVMADSNGSNVTLLNFLEDGLEKLLSLIKQAKNTYKSYYRRTRNKNGQHKEEEMASAGVEVEVAPQNSVDNDIIMAHDSAGASKSGSLGGNNNYERKYAHRRKNREVGEKQEEVMSSMTMITNESSSRGRSSGRVVQRRVKRAVISSQTANGSNGRRGRRVGENEPYYWQMLEDNNNDQHHHHHNQRNNNNHNQHYSQYSHYSNQQHHSHNHHPHQQQSASGGLYSGYGAPPAVASAFTAPGKPGSGADSSNHAGISISSPTSDFHKIRHAMNKLGGGGLDISVVERMILDTKSSRPGVPQNKEKHNKGGPPSSWGNKLLQTNREDEYRKASLNSAAAAALLTTATTKTTQAGRQDESLYVNQLRHQQQQLAQSLLPPTVTWLSNSENGGASAHYLPLPASSLATGEEEEDENGDSEEDDSDEDGKRKSKNGSIRDHSNEVDNEEYDSNENSVSSASRKQQEKMKRKKDRAGRKKSRENNELSYSQKSSIIEKEDENDGDSSRSEGEEDSEYSFRDVTISRNGKEDSSEEENAREKQNNDNSDNNSSSDDNNSHEDDDSIDEDDDDVLENDERLTGGETSHSQQGKKKKSKKGVVAGGDYSTPDGAGKGDPQQQQDCYHTDDVLIVVAITCCLNFAFVLVIWALVRWFSISSNPKEKDFQNLGDCDDTLDPTIVFHGVAEDPCWTLKEGNGRGGGTSGGGGGMIRTRNCDEEGSAGGPGTMRSIHGVAAGNKLDLFPSSMVGKYGGGGMVGASIQNTSLLDGRAGGIGATVMTMTMDRSSRGDAGGYHRGYHTEGGGTNGIAGMRGAGIGSSFVMNGIYSFRPEHVPTHHNTPGGSGMVRSYSQSMEDLRYLQ